LVPAADFGGQEWGERYYENYQVGAEDSNVYENYDFSENRIFQPVVFARKNGGMLKDLSLEDETYNAKKQADVTGKAKKSTDVTDKAKKPADVTDKSKAPADVTDKAKGYTHKTSGFKTSGFKTSGFKTSETSGLQNVRFTKRQVYKMSGLQNVRSSKRPVAKKHP
jgi:hypothetical protein